MSNSEQAINEALRIRISQMLINEEYKAGKFKIPIHLALGHEAIAVAVSHALQSDDNLILSHRNMAYNLARLGKVRPIMDEYHLHPTGLAGGRLGSMNLINPEKNIIYTSSILGNNFPVSAGIAMAEKIKNSGNATFVLCGDGAIEEGSFYESLVMMKSMGLSVVIVMENNGWSLGTHISERRVEIDIQKLISSVEIPYMKLEGNDMEEYMKVIKSAREKAINSHHPVCIEVIVKTLGDRRHPPTPEYPEGKYINYHAGPSPTVDIVQHFNGGILKENEDDPIYVLSQKIGKEHLLKMSEAILAELKTELA